MAETLILAAATTATTAAGTTAVALPWLSTAGSLASIASAGGVAGSIAGAGSLLSGASTLFSLGSAFGQVQSGMQQAAVFKGQSRQYELAARQEELRGREQADRIRRSLQANLASQNAIFAARGVAPTSGSAVGIANRSRTEAGLDIENTMFNAGQSSYQQRAQAQQAKMQGSAARTSGYMKAAQTFAGSSDAFGSLLR